MPRFYDVSLPIEQGMITYPGNPIPKISRYSSLPIDKTNESLICIGSHTGSHVDSALHLQNGVSGAAFLALDSFFGKAKVLDLTSVELEIHQENLTNYRIKKDTILYC